MDMWTSVHKAIGREIETNSRQELFSESRAVNTIGHTFGAGARAHTRMMPELTRGEQVWQ